MLKALLVPCLKNSFLINSERIIQDRTINTNDTAGLKWSEVYAPGIADITSTVITGLNICQWIKNMLINILETVSVIIFVQLCILCYFNCVVRGGRSVAV